MSDTSHVHGTAPAEGDGVSYSGIVWFVVILTATTIFCQVLVWGAFELMEWRAARSEAARAPLSAAPAAPTIEGGRVVTGTEIAPRPSLLVTEPTVLGEFRRAEAAKVSTYGWVDEGAGIVRIPVDRAKALLIERGLPTRPGAPVVAPPAAPPVAARAPVAPAAGSAGH